MKLLSRLELPGAIRAIAVSPDGKRIAALTGTSEEDAQAVRDPELHLVRVARGKATVAESFALHGAPEDGGEGECEYEWTQLAFRDDGTVIVAWLRTITSLDWSESLEVFAVDLETGQQEGRCVDDPSASSVSGLMMASREHLLLGTRHTVLCLDPTSFEEICRARPITERGDPDEEDAFAEEMMMADGFGYDAENRLLYMLNGCYESAAVSCYQFDPDSEEFARTFRRDIWETRPERAMCLVEACGIRPNPDGSGATAILKLQDLYLDLDGRPVPDYDKACKEAFARHESGDVPPAPETVRLGWLAICGEKDDEWVEFHGRLDGDFEISEELEDSRRGKDLLTGYMVGCPQDWWPKPVYIDDRRAVINTPTGALLMVDVTTGEATVGHDMEAAIGSVEYCEAQGCLVVGCVDGSLTRLGIDGKRKKPKKAKKAKRSRARKKKAAVRRSKPKPKEPPTVEASQIFSLAPVYWRTSVAMTADGRLAASGLFVWDVATGENVAPLSGDSSVETVALSPDGRLLLAGAGFMNTLELWDVETGELLRAMRGHTESVADVTVSPDGQRGASGSWDGTVSVWDLETGECLFVLEGHTSDVKAVAFSPDGRQLVSGSDDKTVRIWDLASGECVRTLKGHSNRVKGVSWEGDGSRIVSASWDRTLRLWNPERTRCTRVLRGHTDRVTCVAMTPDGAWAVSGGEDQTLRVWDLETAKCTATLEGHPTPLGSVAVGSGDVAVSASTDFCTDDGRELYGDVRTWDLAKGECLGIVGEDWANVYQVVLSRDGRHLLTRVFDYAESETAEEDEEGEGGICDCTVRVWGLEERTCAQTLTFQAEGTRSAGGSQWGDLSADGRTLICASPDLTIRAWDVTDGSLVAQLEGHQPELMDNPVDGIGCVALSEDGKLAISGADDYTCRFWDVAKGTCLATLEGHTDSVLCLALSADGRRAASGSSDISVRVWDVAAGSCVATLEDHGSVVRGVALSADGRIVVSGDFGGTAKIWDAESGRCLHELSGPEGEPATHVAVSADGSLVATGHEYRTHIWDAATGRALAQYRHTRDAAECIAFGADGQTLVTAGLRIVCVWPLPDA